MPALVSLADSDARAMPKSRILTPPSVSTMTLAGFTSRWMMPERWANASPSHSPSMNCSRCAVGNALCSRMIAASVSPSMYSIAMNGRPSCSPTSKIVTTFGCRSRATARASRANRSRSSSSSSLSSLIATSRSSMGSHASRTMPMPPCPITLRTGTDRLCPGSRPSVSAWRQKDRFYEPEPHARAVDELHVEAVGYPLAVDERPVARAGFSTDEDPAVAGDDPGVLPAE